MPDVLELVIAGEPMRLYADRALYWPARSRLLIADLHLGKGDILRAAGIAVPSGGTAHDLARIDALLQRSEARELWILGDFLHGRHQPQVDAAWRALLAAHPGCVAAVVAGNHDRSLLADSVGVVRLPDDVRDGPFRFRHHPLDVPGPAAGHVLCGHVHPVARLPGLPGRHPALALDAHQSVLPAFSAFTGGQRLDDARHWVACAGGVLAVNAP
ncbi:ligase-associated DNA damage response endonuclease PdeM [Luteimonas sp. MC1572]|uniref:ligase-associated DNA damage response endonuclease PdeM n=1 Tax=Luteimonas sp. MC1572 TaxID=2799325 RepID=UPI0018F07DF4|nr:ligase-associated DNA damage response endonuclease PdeM [Luteimonas sp. MC1572]MBJ6982656.1 ligase-associated DNA damage response endonuclease PdeM [Luteimonas sp. MC1572]QQO03900.1 ligase-associated DNA damage response endonuclease PdeM [Luteimonas sp. MC1572]